MRVFRAVELLIEKIKKDYSDDISLVVIMGSHLYNDTHAKSDLDMYFIPKTPKGFNLGFVFIIDGIGFDFWPIPWERIDRIASWDERIVSILTEGQVEYYGTEEDLAKFNLYKQRALDVSNKGHFIWKAREKINSSFMQYFEVEKSETLSEMRKNGIKLIYSVTEALSLLNRIPIKRGRGKLLSEIMSMPLIPEGFEKFYKVLFDSEDLHEIKKSLVNLFQNTRYLIKKEETKDLLGSFKNEAAGFYEEIINFYNKIERACETEDYYTALFAAAEINIELADMLGNRGVDISQLPDILSAYDSSNLQKLLFTAKLHQTALEKLLDKEGVPVRKFNDEYELQDFLEKL